MKYRIKGPGTLPILETGAPATRPFSIRDSFGSWTPGRNGIVSLVLLFRPIPLTPATRIGHEFHLSGE